MEEIMSEKKYFGYGEREILENFREAGDQVDSNGKISEETTLSQLAEASKQLLKENADFLYSIYNDLDD